MDELKLPVLDEHTNQALEESNSAEPQLIRGSVLLVTIGASLGVWLAIWLAFSISHLAG